MNGPNKRIFPSILGVLCAIISLSVQAIGFIELTIDPQGSNSSDVDQITLLINRATITHVEISLTKTPDQVWYKLIFYSNQKVKNKNSSILLILECRNTKTVNIISSAIRNGRKKPINAFESCRMLEQNSVPSP